MKHVPRIYTDPLRDCDACGSDKDRNWVIQVGKRDLVLCDVCLRPLVDELNEQVPYPDEDDYDG